MQNDQPSDARRESDLEARGIATLERLLASCPLDAVERVHNSHLFVRRQTLARLLFLDEIYQEILDVPGIVVQCGVRFGGDLVTLASLRTLYEPFNHSRRIVGFDTFAGLLGTGTVDQGSASVRDGQFGVPTGYVNYLSSLLDAHTMAAPLAHVHRHELVVGDVSATLPEFLEKHPGEMLSLLYLDMDIYQPTHDALRAASERLVPGSLVVFDEFGDRRFPGEAKVYRELLGDWRVRMKRSRKSTVTAYAILEERIR